MPYSQITHRLSNPVQDIGMIGELGHHRVSAHGHHAARDRPHVEVVDRGDARDRQHAALDFRHRDVAWNRFEQDVGALADQPPGPAQNQYRMSTEMIGSAGVQPVVSRMTAAIKAPTDPSRSPRMWR
jgi:hypothetical protein